MTTPKIESYHFGYIKINGEEHNKDVIIFPDRIISGWWRKSGHSLHKDDLKEILENPPDILIIGKGSVSRMQVPVETKKILERAGIEVKALPTKEACSLYNEIRDHSRVAAALHLTC